MAEEINSATRAIDLRKVHHTRVPPCSRNARWSAARHKTTNCFHDVTRRRPRPVSLWLFDPSSPRPYPVTRDRRHAAGSAAILLRTWSTDAGC